MKTMIPPDIHATLQSFDFDLAISGAIDKIKSPEATLNDVAHAITTVTDEFLKDPAVLESGIYLHSPSDIAIKAGDALIEILTVKLIEMWEAEHDQDRTIMALQEQVQSQRKHIASLQAANQDNPNSIFDEEF